MKTSKEILNVAISLVAIVAVAFALLYFSVFM